MENLDLRCAEFGKEIADKADEKLLTDALSVLEEQGVYAFFLFLKDRGNEQRSKIIDSCREFLEQTPEAGPVFAAGGENDPFPALQELANDLDTLLLARDLLRQGLVYGRYHAKAAGTSGAKG
ncbi:MAG: hypothetical protein RQ767_04125 [Thermovirgaceae bacterium]|nr:hypothetical protein [Thermovirgaceae bacterium]